MRTPKFIFFDLGKVLLNFDVERMCRQIGQVAGLDARQVREAIYGNGLQQQFERGLVSDEEFYEQFCQHTKTRPDRKQLWRAANDIFELNLPVIPIVTHLAHTRRRLGVLSNTCKQHWEFVAGRFRVLFELLPVHTLSFEVHSAKPEPEIFQAAAEAAGCPPAEIFFVDDIADNVQGACQAGLDAVQYTSAADLAAALRSRGVRFNY